MMLNIAEERWLELETDRITSSATSGFRGMGCLTWLATLLEPEESEYMLTSTQESGVSCCIPQRQSIIGGGGSAGADGVISSTGRGAKVSAFGCDEKVGI